jgi:L-malate glycosyltransferase
MPGTLSTDRAAVAENGPSSPRRLTEFQSALSRLKRPSDNGGARVLYLVDTLNVGGTETQMVQAALRLRSMSHHVTVGCLRAEGPLLEVLQQAGVPVVEFRKKKTLLSINGVHQLMHLALFLRRGQFHVIHAHDLWANLLGIPAGRLARTPVIISSRRYLADLDWYTPWRSKIIRTIYRLSTHVVVNSASVRQLLVERDGLPPEKIHIIYNGVDVDRFASARPDRERFLGSVGSDSKLIAVVANMYSRVKGHACLIEAARIVCRAVPTAKFVLIGDGAERSKLEQQVTEAGLEKDFLFLGHRQDVPELLACCNLSVLPSEAEALPNSLLEAMAAGLPVVATRVGGTPEIIVDGVNGLLVPPQDPQALAQAMLHILQDADVARRLSRSGQEKMRTHFGFDRLVAELEELYRDLPRKLGHSSAIHLSAEKQWQEESYAKEQPRGTSPAIVARYLSPRGRAPIFRREFLFECLLPVRGLEVLELGCGSGSTSCVLSIAGARVTGVDISQHAIRLAGRRAELDGVADRCHFYCMSVQELAAQPSQFDIIVADSVLHHMIDDLPAILRSVRELLKPTGLALFVEPLSLSSGLRFLRKYIPIRTDGSPGERPLYLSELQLIRATFERVFVSYFDLFGRFTRLLPATPYEEAGAPIRAFAYLLNRLDWFLLQQWGVLRSYAGYGVIQCWP